MNQKRYWMRGNWGEVYYTELVEHEEWGLKCYEVHEIRSERELREGDREGDRDPIHWAQEYVDGIIQGSLDDWIEDVLITEEEAIWELIK